MANRRSRSFVARSATQQEDVFSAGEADLDLNQCPARSPLWKRLLGELQHQMERLGVSVRCGPEAELFEYFPHRSVLGQNLSRQFLQSGIVRKPGEMTHQHRADASSLPGIDDHKCHLGPPGLEDNVPAASGNHLAAGFFCERDNRDMVFKINVHEEGALSLREVTLHEEEAALQLLRSCPIDLIEHVGVIFSPESADFDLAAVAQQLACGVVDRL